MKALLLSALLVMAFMASMTDVMVESSPLTKRSVENVMESPIDSDSDHGINKRGIE